MVTSNTIYFSRLLKVRFPHISREIESKLKKHGIKPKWLDHTNDIWVRDFMPLQMNDKCFIHYIYYPDYLMERLEDRASITNPIRLEQSLLILQDKIVVNLPLILDGGNAVFTDSHVIMTEKVLVENNLSKINNKEAVSNLIREKMKLEPLYIQWDAPKWNGNKKVEKFGHSDWLVRYLGGPTNMVVVADNEDATRKVSLSAIDKLKEFECYDVQVFKLNNPTPNSWVYLNYVQVNDMLLIPTVAEPENDEEAIDKIRTLFHIAGQSVAIETIDCQDLIKEGGALHCISWNIKI